ncbi:MAG: PQQ-dependent sugar dehydrogenase, partial [Cyclobacteriaceae bacterium]
NDDELNLIKAGGDYGWPYVEGFCDKENELTYCDTTSVIEPLIAWTPTIAPAGLDFYDHPSIPEWQNSLMLTSLKGRSLQVLSLDDSGEEIVSKKIYLQKQFGRFRDLCVSSSGDVYLITSNTDWHINRHPWMYENVPIDGNDRIIKLSPIASGGDEYRDLAVVDEDSAQIRLFTQERINFDIPGTELYVQHCAPCHLPSGKGILDYVPSLLDNEWVNNKTKLIETTLSGLSGEVEVKGSVYNAVMPSFAASLNDEEIAEILNYVKATLNNHQDEVSAEEVTIIRKKIHL